jgi:endo-1,4-beta-xylanase
MAALPASAAPTEEEILAGADARIQQHRTALARIVVMDRLGRPVPGTRVRVEQQRHAFLFGANAFPLLGHADPAREALYQKRFTDLLNYATLGFYWGAYEREPGKTDADRLERQARWLKSRGIPAKGHPLVWHEVYPGWAPSDPDDARNLLRQRVVDIVGRFKGLIDRWDVVNEVTVSDRFDNGVGRWAKRDGGAKLVAEALEWARGANRQALLLYNDFNVSPAYEKLAEELTRRRGLVDALGIQSHMHGGEWTIPRAWEVCETYARFGVPLHFTELTVLSGPHGWNLKPPWPTTPAGEARQADYVVKLYTTLFSHPAVEAITWWDLHDGAWQGAPAGLIRADYSPKPAYERLLALIRDRWWTRVETETGPDGVAAVRGFLGDHEVSVEQGGAMVRRPLRITRTGANRVTLTLP